AAMGGARLFPAHHRALPRRGRGQRRREPPSDSALRHDRVRVGYRDRLHASHARQRRLHLVARDTRTMSAALYICYFGLREPLVQTQVLPYLRELAARGHRMSLLTFEPSPWRHGEGEQWRERLQRDG